MPRIGSFNSYICIFVSLCVTPSVSAFRNESASVLSSLDYANQIAQSETLAGGLFGPFYSFSITTTTISSLQAASTAHP